MLSTLKIFLNLAFNKRGKILNYSLENLNFLFLLRYLIILVLGFHIVEKRNISLVQVYIRAYQAAPRNPLKNPNPIKIPPQINKGGLFNIITE